MPNTRIPQFVPEMPLGFGTLVGVGGGRVNSSVRCGLVGVEESEKRHRTAPRLVLRFPFWGRAGGSAVWVVKQTANSLGTGPALVGLRKAGVFLLIE